MKFETKHQSTVIGTFQKSDGVYDHLVNTECFRVVNTDHSMTVSFRNVVSDDWYTIYMTNEQSEMFTECYKQASKNIKKVRVKRGGKTLCKLIDTGNGFIVKFNPQSSCQQKYYVCLDYCQFDRLGDLFNQS